MPQYVDPYVFEWTNGKGQDPKKRGYPNNWTTPHFHQDNAYNPHLRVLMNEPDGTREYFDPVTQTHSYEHSSGYHHSIMKDGTVTNVPGKAVHFYGGGGLAETVSGQHDMTRAGHYRENNQGDTYVNTKGVSHSFSQGGSVSCNMGNETHEHYGSCKHRVMGSGGAFGIGVGAGGGSATTHDMNFGMTANRTHINAATQGDLMLTTSSNNITHNSGKDHNIMAQQSINHQAQQDVNHTAQNNANLVSQQITQVVGKKKVLINGGGMTMPPLTILPS